MTQLTVFRVNFSPSYGELHLTQKWACLEHYLKIIDYFENWFDYLEANCLRKFKNDIQILVGPVFLELLIETCKNCLYIVYQ